MKSLNISHNIFCILIVLYSIIKYEMRYTNSPLFLLNIETMVMLLWLSLSWMGFGNEKVFFVFFSLYTFLFCGSLDKTIWNILFGREKREKDLGEDSL